MKSDKKSILKYKKRFQAQRNELDLELELREAKKIKDLKRKEKKEKN